MNDVILPFTQAEFEKAYADWQCNCGPCSAAAVLGKKLDEIRPAVDAVGFGYKRYMNPSMMKQAILLAGGTVVKENACGFGVRVPSSLPTCGLVMFQWSGPWTAPNANPRWAMLQTHWTACWKLKHERATIADELSEQMNPAIFDVSFGLLRWEEWQAIAVPAYTKNTPRADGGFYIAKSWEVSRAASSLILS